MRALAKWLMWLSLVGWAGTWVLMQRLPPADEIRPELYRQPIQNFPSVYGPFTFDYHGQTISVTPMADYNLWGMVVSHNDPTAWYRFDITHDDQSPDIRDLCVIWGGNVKKGNYSKIHAKNDDWSCEYRLGDDIRYFSDDEISNNHLISNSKEIRKRIRNIEVGDQIFIKGILVNYSESRWKGNTRNTSLSRSDRGNGACEIIFVQDIQVLSSYNRAWIEWHRLLLQAFFLLLAFRCLMFFVVRDET